MRLDHLLSKEHNRPVHHRLPALCRWDRLPASLPVGPPAGVLPVGPPAGVVPVGVVWWQLVLFGQVERTMQFHRPTHCWGSEESGELSSWSIGPGAGRLGLRYLAGDMALWEIAGVCSGCLACWASLVWACWWVWGCCLRSG